MPPADADMLDAVASSGQCCMYPPSSGASASKSSRFTLSHLDFHACAHAAGSAAKGVSGEQEVLSAEVRAYVTPFLQAKDLLRGVVPRLHVDE